MAQDDMKDLFKDMVQRAPVSPQVMNEGVESLLAKTETILDKPTSQISTSVNDAGVRTMKAFRQAHGYAPVETTDAEVEARRLATREAYALHMQQQAMERAGVFGAAVVNRMQASHMRVKKPMELFKERRAIVAVLWLMGASWNDIAIVTKRSRPTCADLGHRALAEHGAGEVAKERNKRSAFMSITQLEYLWKYTETNVSMFNGDWTLASIFTELDALPDSR